MFRKNDENSFYCAFRDIEKIFFTIVFIIMIFPVSLRGEVTGPCSNCHTMHNSQHGSHMQYLAPGETDTGPKDALLRGTCLACHSSTRADTAIDSVTGAPIVFNSVEPTYNSAKGLAAGNFYWVKNDDAKGHNVFADNADDTLTVAPGKPWGCSGNNSCHDNIHGTTNPSALGMVTPRQGCNKCHMMGSDPPRNYHHAKDPGPIIDSAAEGWYRFLAGHMSGAGHGVTGIEDNDWELETSSDHNEYLGFNDGQKNIPLGFGTGVTQNIMTAYCCGCHGDFHKEDTTASGSSPWIRHPSDTILPSTGEYSAYTTYDPLVPVARPDLTGWTGSSNTVTPGQDLVMCLSCHRAHASPYFKMLRWDYKGWPGNAGSNGCNVCHSSKD